MSLRIDESWIVLASIENEQHDRCVDLFARPGGTFGFEAFRRDPEDAGRWTAVSDHSAISYLTRDRAMHAARRAVPRLT
ncbi:hypothetical protein AA12717_4016 [Gluconacetobacter sacchari DSM 12717]|uniref:Uncharacterized protein n=2 Tax=Gluconacetobacter sacchari TaxID=92759 RepID=A0A7W4NSW9_9PROT|nr:hypothetical protein [Gluconacetobacter sacchari]MBB2162508.1 hypothetical protein [Gluconacetobacter sacchari]GBQ32619.1 hypothetical protein AA12717_4016 [Gluconacetobacter sacchari DSM 12717]